MRGEPVKVYLACGETDMRRQINGLSAIVQETLGLDPFGAAMYVFCNSRRNRIKLLWWDQNGFWMYLKRLDKGRFKWPKTGEASTMQLTPEELDHLLQGTKLEQKLKRDELEEPKLY